MQFSELNLSNELLKAIKDVEYQEMTYIQEKCIPHILEGQDIIGQSQTGTGKTAAFLIPIIEMLNQDEVKKPKALILTPTRELNLQVSDEIRKFAKYKAGIKTISIYGGTTIQKQIQDLKKCAQIIVGTPGRIIDHINRKTLDLSEIKYLVLDEADEMLNMGFREDVEKIMENINNHHQTILFSATMPKAILDITHLYQKNPIHIKTKQKEISANTIKQYYYEVNQSDKKYAIMQLIKLYKPRLSMIFCNTKKMVDELSTFLISKGYAAMAIHGDMKQEMRLSVLNKFRDGLINILIATDVAARGIDIDDIDIVFNFDFPLEDEYYIHRIGRTGRALKDGVAITLITSRQKDLIKNIEKKTNSKLEKKELPSGEELVTIQTNQIKDEINHLLNQNIPYSIDNIVYELMNDGYDLVEVTKALIYKTMGLDLLEEIKKPKEENLIVTHKAYTTIDISLGKNCDIQPAHIVSAIAEASGLSGKDIGKIKVKDTYTLVEVPSQYDKLIISCLKNITIKDHDFNVKIYKEPRQKKKKRKVNPENDITQADILKAKAKMKRSK